MLSQVMRLWAHGLSIVPIDRNKKPIIDWKLHQTERLSSREAIRLFREGDANVAVVTGALSGVVVLDVDVRGEIDGFATLEENGWTIPVTPAVRTGGGGRHFYFSHPGIPIANRVGFARGLDVRGDGGLAIAPPSIHENGKTYVWEIPFRRDDLAEMPEWLLSLCKQREATIDPRSSTAPMETSETSAYGLAALHEEIENIRSAQEGTRNDQLFKSATSLFELESGGEITGADFELVTMAALESGLPDYEIRTTLASAMARGSTNPRSRPLVELPPTIEIASISLLPGLPNGVAERTMAAVRKTFAGYQHTPSQEQYEGLQQIALMVESMAEGRCSSDIFVSSMPPGTGKTSTLTQAVREVIADTRFADKGVIIFVSRRDEIRRLADGMGLYPGEFAVLTSDSEANELGSSARGDARVLFTTQQQLQARTQGTKSFVDMEVFWFRDKPRQVRIWDEAILSTSSLPMGRFQLDRLKQGLANDGSADLVEELDKLTDALRSSSAGTLVTVPNLRRIYTTLSSLSSIFDGRDLESAQTLWRLGGRSVRVFEDAYVGNAIIDYDDILPSDLGPLLVLDASAALRSVYSLWANKRGGLKFLKSATKDFSGLTIHHWNRGAGKVSQARDKQNLIAEGVAKAINKSIPADEAVLVVHYKKDQRDFEAIVKELVWNSPERVNFCHWGLHTATNEYSHIKHVIIAGLLSYGAAANEAAARGAAGLSSGEDLEEGVFENVRLGEISHHLYQAANRGFVRRSDGESCPSDVHLYVAFSTNSLNGVPLELLSRVFPGAKISSWIPVHAPIGNQAKLINAIFRRMEHFPETVDRADLATELGLKTQRQLLALLTHPTVVGYFEDCGFELQVDRKTVRAQIVGGAVIRKVSLG